MRPIQGDPRTDVPGCSSPQHCLCVTAKVLSSPGCHILVHVCPPQFDIVIS